MATRFPQHLLLCLLGASAILAASRCSPGNDAQSSTITVYAASSLTETFTELGREFEDRNPGVQVRFNFAASSVLQQQVEAGAPADLVAFAGPLPAQRLHDRGLVAAPRLFARNRPALIVPIGNPANIRDLQDLSRPGTIWGACVVQAPCGDTAHRLMAQRAVAIEPVTREANVRAVLNKVAMGELDAGIAYATDVIQHRDRVQEVPVVETQNITTEYPIALVQQTDQPALAQQFLDFVLESPAQAVLKDAGFTAAPE